MIAKGLLKNFFDQLIYLYSRGCQQFRRQNDGILEEHGNKYPE